MSPEADRPSALRPLDGPEAPEAAPTGAAPGRGRPSPWGALSGTQRELVLALLRHGRRSRPEIMDELGISAGSVTRLSAPLLEAGLLESRTERVASTGRPQSPLEISTDFETVLGAVLTVRSLAVVLTDLRASVLATVRRPLTDHTPTAVADAVASACAEAVAQAPGAPAPACLGVALGGSARDGRTVDEATFFGWHEVPLARLLEERTGLPTEVGNDLAALTLEEAWFGVGRESARFTLVTVGAGVGHGLVVDGAVVTTPDSELGLMGMIPVPNGARPPVAERAMDCLTNAAIERTWTEGGHAPRTAEEVVALAEAGDADAVRLCESFARRLGRYIGIAAAFSLPEVVVVAGERAGLAALFEDQVMAGIAAVRRASASTIPLVVREHDRVHWARGGATLALRERIAGRL